jgi:hypothetical protein
MIITIIEKRKCMLNTIQIAKVLFNYRNKRKQVKKCCLLKRVFKPVFIRKKDKSVGICRNQGLCNQQKYPEKYSEFLAVF